MSLLPSGYSTTSSIQHLVLPKLPTTIADQTYIDVPGYDIWFCHINILHVVPTRLDVSKFEEALSRALQLYPHAAGQLRHIDRCWFIELTNTAVPVNIENKFDSSSDSLLHGDWVVQHDISPFLNPQPIGANVINDGSPLLRLKLTFFHNNETCVGVSWQHSLGDAVVLFRFMHTLSQFYQGLSPEFAPPSFKKHHFPSPPNSVVAEFWPHMPHLHATCHFRDVASPESPSRKHFEHVTWRIDSCDIEVLRSSLSKRGNNPLLSKHDCLIAYLVSVLNRNRSNPVQQVTNLSSYRNVKASFITDDMASNLLLDVLTNVPIDIAGIASAVRDASIQCRDPDYIYGWVTLSSNIRLEAANTGKTFPFPFRDNKVIVNSLTRIDWCSAHFGCPDGTRFHLDGVCKHSVRFSRSNPVKGVDGVWRPRQSVDISIGVPPELKPKLLHTLARGVRCMLDD